MQETYGAGAVTRTQSASTASAGTAPGFAAPASAGRSVAPQSRPGPALVRAVLADGAPLMHLAVRSVLAGMPGHVLAGAAGTVAEAEQLVRRVRPELLICEATIAGESGIGLCRWTRQVSPGTTVVILTGRDEPLLVQSALSAGAMGFLLKDSPAESLMAALRQVRFGMRALDERLGRTRPGLAGGDSAAEFGLSPREREVLDEVVLGFDNKFIAARLCISEDTVKSHVKAIFRKLGARDRAHAVALALGSATMTLPTRTLPAGVQPRPARPGSELPEVPRPRSACR
jgi:DNA-binding NarL/FixJ family response regulator